MTKRESILAAVLTQLKTISSEIIDDDSIVRSRVNPYQKSNLPAISVHPGPDKVENISIPFTDWSLIVRVKIYAGGDVPDSLADTIVEAVNDKMVEDTSLGGLTMDISPLSVTPEFDEGDVTFVEITSEFEIKYRE
jgi:hypothetical protein